MLTPPPSIPQPFRELGVKACRECQFAQGGHLLAAVNGSTISIYDFYTGEKRCDLRGHNSKVMMMMMMMMIMMMMMMMMMISHEESFSVKMKGGHLLAAVNGSTISIYDFYTGEKRCDLHGHNSKVMTVMILSGGGVDDDLRYH
jgi:WD40 repeat protein